MAPEIFQVYGQDSQSLSYSNKCDIWSLGTVLYEMLLGHNLTKIINFSRKGEKIMQLKEFLLKKEDIQIKCSNGLSEQAVHLLSKMLKKNPFTRIDIDQVLAHPWMKQKPDEKDENTLLISFFMVDDLQQKGTLNKLFFSLPQTKVSVCKIFINRLMQETRNLYQKLENFLTKAASLEARLEDAKKKLGGEAQEILEQDWSKLFQVTLQKTKYLFEKINDFQFEMSNKHIHMMYNYFIQNRRKIKSYASCCQLVKSIEDKLEPTFSSLHCLSRTNLAEDYDTNNQSECNSNLRIQEGVLACVEILQNVVLCEYLHADRGALLVRDVLLDCFEILCFDLSEFSYEIEFARSLAPEVSEDVHSISFFLSNIHKINELDSRSGKSYSDEDTPAINFQRNQFNVYKQNSHIWIDESEESGWMFEEDEHMQKIGNLVKIRVVWEMTGVFKNSKIQEVARQLFGMFKEYKVIGEKSTNDSMGSLDWSDQSVEEGRSSGEMKKSWDSESDAKKETFFEFN